MVDGQSWDDHKPGHDEVEEQHNDDTHCDVCDARIEEGEVAMVARNGPAHVLRLQVVRIVAIPISKGTVIWPAPLLDPIRQSCSRHMHTFWSCMAASLSKEM